MQPFERSTKAHSRFPPKREKSGNCSRRRSGSQRHHRKPQSGGASTKSTEKKEGSRPGKDDQGQDGLNKKPSGT